MIWHVLQVHNASYLGQELRHAWNLCRSDCFSSTFPSLSMWHAKEVCKRQCCLGQSVVVHRTSLLTYLSRCVDASGPQFVMDTSPLFIALQTSLCATIVWEGPKWDCILFIYLRWGADILRFLTIALMVVGIFGVILRQYALGCISDGSD